IREERARYCRCVYETSKKEDWTDAFVNAMEIDVPNRYNLYDYDEEYPLLQDVIDARPHVIADLNLFLTAWKKALTQKGLNTRPAVLLLETSHRLEGLDGVSKLARKWKNKQPQGYLFWLDILKRENDPKSIIKVSAEGLKALEKGRPRKQVAQFLIDAAEKIGDAKNLLLGKRERLYSRPSDHDLIEFVGEAVKQDVRERELKKVITFFRSGTLEDSDETALYIKALLMGGKLPDAFTLVEKEKSVGWSYFSNTGVVFGAILSMLADHHGKATTIKTLFCGYANRESAYSGRMSIDDEPGTSFYEEIVKGLKQQKQTEAEKKKYFSWAEKIGKGRIDHIVSNKHRNAYERAAQVLGALAEAYMTRGQNDKAKKIIHHFYAEKYNRFSAFRREVKSVVTSSQLLRTAGFLN
ncbi:MAG: hypothetical protein U9Q05_10835, partial [Thermodesulfobacteriota bacterium]|nr:hypothetical protein [Thermodesulfobacteriota bacterium]